jgi:hypothetical protein
MNLETDVTKLGRLSKTFASLSREQCVNSAGPILALLCLLGLYAAVILITPSPASQGDSAGYVANAARILHIAEDNSGPYKHIFKEAQKAGPVDASQDLRLWWGPGYPFVLVPFVAFQLPWITAELLNAVFHLLAILYFYALIGRYTPANVAVLATACLALYPPLMRNLGAIGPEDLTLLLICGFMFHFCALYNQVRHRRMHLLTGSLYLAYLAVTKVFFGYVIVGTVVMFSLLLLSRYAHMVRTPALVFAFALMCCVPYLSYTYHLTRKPFYWGSSGGMSLYWMSTPYPNESGSWFSFRAVNELPELAPHRKFFATLKSLSDVERDDAFKKQAVSNIRQHPLKYLANWMANMGRLLFSYPYSFTPQKLSTYFFLPNYLLVFLFILSIIPAAMRWAAIPLELWLLLLFALIIIGGSSLLSAYERQFMPVIPILSVWVAFVYVRVLRIELRSHREIHRDAYF